MGDGFSQRFYGPTSFTLAEAVAVMFASQSDDGIVVEIKNDGLAVCLDCRALSDFGAESEMLFLGGRMPVIIVGISTICNGVCYKMWIKAIAAFDALFVKGWSLRNMATDFNERCIRSLIANINGNVDPMIPEYVQSLFVHFVSRTKCIKIDLVLFQKEIVVQMGQDLFPFNRYGWPTLRDIYFHKNGMLKWREIIALFPKLMEIEIVRNELKTCTSRPSLKVTHDDLQRLQEILQGLDRKIRIEIRYPLNKKSELRALVEQHGEEFLRIGFTMWMTCKGTGTTYLIIEPKINDLIGMKSE